MPRSVRQEAEKAKLNKVQVSNLVNMSRHSKDSKSCVIEAIKRGLSTQCKRSLINPRFQLGDGGCTELRCVSQKTTKDKQGAAAPQPASSGGGFRGRGGSRGGGFSDSVQANRNLLESFQRREYHKMLLGKGPSAVAGTMLNTLATSGFESLLQDLAKDPLNAVQKVFNFASSSAGVGVSTAAAMAVLYPMVRGRLNAQFGAEILPDIDFANKAFDWAKHLIPASVAEMLDPKDNPPKQDKQAEPPTTKQGESPTKEEPKEPTPTPTPTAAVVVGGATAVGTTLVTGNPAYGAFAGIEAGTVVNTAQQLYKTEAFYKAQARNKIEKDRIGATNRATDEKQYKFETKREDKAKSDNRADKMQNAKELDQKYRFSDKRWMDWVAYQTGTGDKALLVDEKLFRFEHSGQSGQQAIQQTTNNFQTNNNIQDNTRQETKNIINNKNTQNTQYLPQHNNGFAKYEKTRSNTNSVTLVDSIDVKDQRGAKGFDTKIAEQGVQLRLAGIQKTSQAIGPPIVIAEQAAAGQLESEQPNGEQLASAQVDGGQANAYVPKNPFAYMGFRMP